MTAEPYLLCFDNADDISLVNDCLPRANNGTVLITSKDPVAAEEIVDNRVTVPEFSLSEGCEFLSSLLPDVDVSVPKNKKNLEDICTVFHGYPLALAQSASFIRTGGCSLDKFLTLFQNKRNSMAIKAMAVSDYQKTLLTVWDLSFQALSDRSRQILEILVYLDPDTIPYELLETGCLNKSTQSKGFASLEYMANPVEFYDALRGLRGQSLVRSNRALRTMSIHRFLQEETFQHLCAEPARRRRAFEETLFLITNFQPEFPNVTQHWSPDLFRESELCLPHTMRLAHRFSEDPEVFAGLENNLGKLIFESAS